MKTFEYNPSSLEVAFAKTLVSLKSEIEKKIGNLEIIDIKNNVQSDNPTVKFSFVDTEGDKHELVVKIIQRPD